MMTDNNNGRTGFNASKNENWLVCTKGNDIFTTGNKYKVVEYDKFDNWQPFKIKDDRNMFRWVGGFYNPKDYGLKEQTEIADFEFVK